MRETVKISLGMVLNESITRECQTRASIGGLENKE